jgi:hypothetical protein
VLHLVSDYLDQGVAPVERPRPPCGGCRARSRSPSSSPARTT